MSLFDRLFSRYLSPSKPDAGRAAVPAGALFGCALAASLTAGSASAANGFESVFDCGDVIGTVFADKNSNGYQDQGEPGLPGVRLATVRGLLSVTDKQGRYHVTCAQTPRGGIGSIFVLKLDDRTLPAGYRITSENPRAVRLTRGKVTKLNFGASTSRVVRLDLAGAAFEANGTGLNPKWETGIDQLMAVLGEDHSVLRLTYEAGAEDKVLARARMRAVSDLVKARWQQDDPSYRLEIERRMINKALAKP